MYFPGKNLSFDNYLLLYKRHLHFKQSVRIKRARFVIKLYELCRSNGITLDFLVYCRKRMFSNNDMNSNIPSTEETQLNRPAVK